MKKNCLSCSNSKFKKLFLQKKFPILFGAIPIEKKKNIKKYPIEISICKNCGLVQQTKIPKKEIIDEIYTSDYYSCGSPLTSGMGVKEIENFFSFFKKYNNNPKKVLEIGCFDGYLLNKISKLGWDVYGCDPSPVVNKTKVLIGKKRIKQVFFSEKNYQNQFFDVIIFRNLLEHILDLNIFLKNVYNCLNHKGKIFIEVPDIKKIVKLGGLGLFFHEHISYFSIETLSYLLLRNGFKIKTYYEGNPNIFLEAEKIKIVENKKFKKINFKINNIDKNYFKIKNKILSIFKNKKINLVVLFGASALATSIATLLNTKQRKKIVLVLDNDKLKQNKILGGTNIKISEPKKILKSNFDIVLIATYFFIKEIKKNLIKFGINKSKIKTLI